jgi:ethanolamine transporter EutH
VNNLRYFLAGVNTTSAVVGFVVGNYLGGLVCLAVAAWLVSNAMREAAGDE